MIINREFLPDLSFACLIYPVYRILARLQVERAYLDCLVQQHFNMKLLNLHLFNIHNFHLACVHPPLPAKNFPKSNACSDCFIDSEVINFDPRPSPLLGQQGR